LGALPTPPGEPPLVADPSLLEQSAGRRNISDAGIEQTIRWWREQLMQ
jgi:hypothetical protein